LTVTLPAMAARAKPGPINAATSPVVAPWATSRIFESGKRTFRRNLQEVHLRDRSKIGVERKSDGAGFP